MEILCQLLSRIPILRSIEIKWNDHRPEVTWERKRQTFLESLGVLSECRTIAIKCHSVAIDGSKAIRPGVTLMELPETELTQSIKEITGIQPTWC